MTARTWAVPHAIIKRWQWARILIRGLGRKVTRTQLITGDRGTQAIPIAAPASKHLPPQNNGASELRRRKSQLDSKSCWGDCRRAG
eukprot:4997015-Prymnesium_polylepis.2